jgi:hypothetical protein
MDAHLAELNPRLVACHIGGFGANGPYAHRPAYDAVAQALSGMSSLFLDPEDPRIAGPTISDNVTGQYACYGILGALLARERTGQGRRVDVNMLDSTLAFMPDPFGYFTQMGLVSDPQLRTQTSQSNAFRCADSRLVTIHLSSQEKFWRQFVELIGLPELLTDPLTATRNLRLENYEHIRHRAAAVFIERPLAAWLDALAATDLPYAPVYNVSEVLDDPQVRHLGSFADREHPEMGTVKAIRRPVLFDGDRADQPQKAPPCSGSTRRRCWPSWPRWGRGGPARRDGQEPRLIPGAGALGSDLPQPVLQVVIGGDAGDPAFLHLQEGPGGQDIGLALRLGQPFVRGEVAAMHHELRRRPRPVRRGHHHHIPKLLAVATFHMREEA